MKHMILTALLILAGFAGPANAQHPVKHDHDALGAAGKFYSGWNRPNIRNDDGTRRVSCCSEMDCEAVTVVRRGGKWFAVNHKSAPGEEIEIPAELLEHLQSDPRESPDGMSHVCINMYTKEPLCAVLGGGN